MLKETRERRNDITLMPPVGYITKVVVTSFLDFASNISKNTQYGQTVILNGIRYVFGSKGHNIYHQVDWAIIKNVVYRINLMVHKYWRARKNTKGATKLI